MESVIPLQSEMQAIDINQGPRAFEQMCMNRNPPSNNSENTRDADVNPQERCVRWQSPSSLPITIHKLFEEFKVTSYLPLFEKQCIDAEAFLTLTDEDLK